MVKIAQMDIPPEFAPLLAKILAWFDNQIYPTWATRNRHNTRSAKAALKEKTILPKAKDYWALLSAPDKLIWKNARFGVYRSSYSLFLADFAYRLKNGLSLPGDPPVDFQTYGLMIDNPLGLEYVDLSYDAKDLIGPVSLQFNYQKTEFSIPDPYSFGVHVDLYYFEDGLNKVETVDWISGSGTLPWSLFNETFGTPGRKYFHVVAILYSAYYDATVFIDNFLLSDANGDVKREIWKTTPDLVWEYDPLYRKQGWLFTPGFESIYFQVLYLNN